MDQINMFQQMYKKLPKWVGKLKLGTFFTGIGAPEGALKDIGIDVDLQFFSEIDKYAIKGYCEIHNVDEELGVGSINDLKGIDLPYCDMWFGGFPCQDISLAGNGKGFNIEAESKSSLGWEMIRLAREVQEKPKYIVFENVANILSKSKKCSKCDDYVKFPHHRKCKCGESYLITNFTTLQNFKQDLQELGYKLYDKLLNAKHFGSPQNRNRYFLVAILGEYNYNFPKPIKLELRLKDLLEDEVDEKYYLSDKMIDYIFTKDSEKKSNGSGTYQVSKNSLKIDREVAVPVTTREGNTRADSSNYISIPEATKKGYSEAKNGDGIYLDRPHQKRGVVQKGMTPTIKCSGDDIGVVVKGNYSPSGHNASRIVDEKGIAPTVMENHGTVTAVQIQPKDRDYKKKGINREEQIEARKDKISNAVLTNDTKNMLQESNLRIRKLTPLECYRLQAFTDEDYYKAASVISNSQLYKTAGNSINRNVLKAIFTNLLKEETNEKDIK